MSVKINRLEIENVKRVKAVELEPAPDGLTIVGGKNSQGKTSVLDSIAWAVGGDRFKPSQPAREGSVTPPHIKVELSNGLLVERRGPNSSLKVIDPNGNKGGQQLLNEFVEAFALDLPRFMQATSKEKATTLLKIIGVGEQLFELEAEEKRLYNKRHEIGQIALQKQKAADEMQHYPTAPAEPVSASELIREQQEILARNGENQRKREQIEVLRATRARLEEQVFEFSQRLKETQAKLVDITADLEIAEKTERELTDESTAEIEASIASIDEINARVRANQAKSLIADEAVQYQAEYDGLTASIESIRAEKLALLNGADLPLEGLSVEDGELTYRGKRWDSMSGSEQLRVATAIVRRLNPECGFVLIDKLEQLDLDTLSEFGKWLESEGLQVIATRVSTGGECSIVIEDGYAVERGDTTTPYEVNEAAGWKPGEF